jgi:2-oxoglutarate ferredoxin oxidoreductase subunit gamma
MHESVIMSGFGGQGILLMGQLLCYAGMQEGLKVTWMPRNAGRNGQLHGNAFL